MKQSTDVQNPTDSPVHAHSRTTVWSTRQQVRRRESSSKSWPRAVSTSQTTPFAGSASP